MKKICVVTAARSEYGLLRWTIEGIKKDPVLQLQLVVAGSHLDERYGMTYKEIEKDGYIIDYKIPFLKEKLDKKGIAESMGMCILGFAEAFDSLKPDMVVVLGDRYELLPICSAALIFNIPIAHISGGEVTIGAIDNEIRNAVSMMASLHFPGTMAAKNNLINMGISSESIHNVGEPSVENAKRLPILNRNEIARLLDLNVHKKWISFTFHPETKSKISDCLEAVNTCLSVLIENEEVQVIAGYSNADFGGERINSLLDEYQNKYPEVIRVKKNLGELLYTSLLSQAFLMVGNSSSGIYETQIWKLPVLNIGRRQQGRPRSCNIIDCDMNSEEIMCKLNNLLNSNYDLNLGSIDNIFGNGTTSTQIVFYIKNFYGLE